MKTYSFPYGGSFGRGDSWEGENDFELTDEEAERLEASAREKPRYELDEDPEISDSGKRSDFAGRSGKRRVNRKETSEEWP